MKTENSKVEKIEKGTDWMTDVCSPAEPPGSERIPVVVLEEPGRKWNCAAFHDSHTCTKTHTNKWYKCLLWILSVFSLSVSLSPPHLPVSHRHIHEEQKQTAFTQSGAWEDTAMFSPYQRDSHLSAPALWAQGGHTDTDGFLSSHARTQKIQRQRGLEVKGAGSYLSGRKSSIIYWWACKVKVVRRWLPRAAIICLVMILLTPEQLCRLPPQLIGRCWLWTLPEMAGYTHTHTHTQPYRTKRGTEAILSQSEQTRHACEHTHTRPSCLDMGLIPR